MDKKIIDLIKNHEEFIDGKGYPFGDTSFSFSEQIISMCDKFEKMVNVFKVNILSAQKVFFKEYKGKFDDHLMTSLKELLVAQGVKSWDGKTSLS